MSARPAVAVVRTGCANLASVIAALSRAGAGAVVTDDPAAVRDTPAVILPGVGALGPAMLGLRERGLDRALNERIADERPLLAICLGLQLLCRASEESPGIAGLGAIDAVVTRFDPALPAPQLGWNTVAPTPGSRLLRPGYAYFANSYRLGAIPPGWSGAVSDYAGPFVAAVERGPILACQFHPELSGRFGLSLIRRWLKATGVFAEVPC